jgi:hypothetical protein
MNALRSLGAVLVFIITYFAVAISTCFYRVPAAGVTVLSESRKSEIQ